jgi:hypothetical protein
MLRFSWKMIWRINLQAQIYCSACQISVYRQGHAEEQFGLMAEGSRVAKWSLKFLAFIDLTNKYKVMDGQTSKRETR